MGYPAAGMRNYLARLGWSHGDDEFFTDAQAREWFDLEGSASPGAASTSRSWRTCAASTSAAMDDAALLHELQDYLRPSAQPLSPAKADAATGGAMYCSRTRARTFPELLEKAHFVLTDRPDEPDEKAAKALDTVSRGILGELTPQLQNASWTRDELEAVNARVCRRARGPNSARWRPDAGGAGRAQ